jgi:hypothetical protein
MRTLPLTECAILHSIELGASVVSDITALMPPSARHLE